MNTKIYVVVHKQTDLPEVPGYVPLVVGKNPDVQYTDGIRDNTLDNIADKNPNYCELTGLYWLWKNVHDVKYIGLSHYRRYFETTISGKDDSCILSVEKAESLLQKYDVIMAYPYSWFDETVEQWFLDTDGKEKDIKCLREVIAEKYPSYLDEYDHVMQGYSASYLNLFVMSKELMDQYCSWLFDILAEVENRTDLTGYTPLEARIYGFMSERLLNVWVQKQNFRVKYLHIYQRENPKSRKEDIKDILKYIVVKHHWKFIMKNLSFGKMHK